MNKPFNAKRSMTKVMVEKLVDGKHDTTFSFPAFLLKAASILLPQSALNALGEKGMNVADMLAARRRGIAYSTSMDVVEKGVRKTVVVSVV